MSPVSESKLNDQGFLKPINNISGFPFNFTKGLSLTEE